MGCTVGAGGGDCGAGEGWRVCWKRRRRQRQTDKNSGVSSWMEKETKASAGRERGKGYSD